MGGRIRLLSLLLLSLLYVSQCRMLPPLGVEGGEGKDSSLLNSFYHTLLHFSESLKETLPVHSNSGLELESLKEKPEANEGLFLSSQGRRILPEVSFSEPSLSFSLPPRETMVARECSQEALKEAMAAILEAQKETNRQNMAAALDAMEDARVHIKLCQQDSDVQSEDDSEKKDSVVASSLEASLKHLTTALTFFLGDETKLEEKDKDDLDWDMEEVAMDEMEELKTESLSDKTEEDEMTSEKSREESIMENSISKIDEITGDSFILDGRNVYETTADGTNEKFVEDEATGEMSTEETNSDESSTDEANMDETNMDETNSDETNTVERDMDETNTVESDTDETTSDMLEEDKNELELEGWRTGPNEDDLDEANQVAVRNDRWLEFVEGHERSEVSEELPASEEKTKLDNLPLQNRIEEEGGTLAPKDFGESDMYDTEEEEEETPTPEVTPVLAAVRLMWGSINIE